MRFTVLALAESRHLHGAVQMSALCQSEDGKAHTLRVWNSSGKDQKAALRTALPVQTVREMRMDETKELDTISGGSGSWSFDLPKGRVMTLRLER